MYRLLIVALAPVACSLSWVSVGCAQAFKHNAVVMSAAIVDEDKTLLILDADGYVGKWDLATGRNISSFDSRVKAQEHTQLRVEGRYLSFTGRDKDFNNAVVVLAWASGKEVYSLTADNGGPGSIYWLDETRFVVYRHPKKGSNSLTIYRERDGKFQQGQNIDLGERNVYWVGPAQDERVVIACGSGEPEKAGENNQLVLYDLKESRVLKEVTTTFPLSKVELCAVAQSGRLLVTGNCRIAEVYDGESLKRLARIEVPKSHLGFKQGDIAPSGKLAILGGPRAELWDLTADKLILLDELNEQQIKSPKPVRAEDRLNQAFGLHFLQLCHLQFISDGKQAVGVSHTGEVHVWDVEQRKTLRKFSVVK